LKRDATSHDAADAGLRLAMVTVRPHCSLGYRPPAPEAWQAESKAGHGKVESKKRFQLFHTLDYGGEMMKSLTALH
jgi:hypothetical protein